MIKKNSKIFIAGHKGLLGSSILNQLRANAFSNLICKTHHELDLTNQYAVFNFFKKENLKYVFLCAGKSGGIDFNKKNPATLLYVNSAIQNNVFEASHKFGVENIIFYGSSCGYPKNCRQPMNESDFLSGSLEETSLSYAVAKIMGIVACKAYNKQYDAKKFIAMIPNTMYGPNSHFDEHSSHVIEALIAKFHYAKINNIDSVTLWGSGKPKREFVFAEDVARASILLMNNADKLENIHYNCGFGEEHSIQELAEMIRDIVGYSGNILWDKSKPDGTMQKILDSSRLRELGFQPSVNLKEGLQRTYQSYINNY